MAHAMPISFPAFPLGDGHYLEACPMAHWPFKILFNLLDMLN